MGSTRSARTASVNKREGGKEKKKTQNLLSNHLRSMRSSKIQFRGSASLVRPSTWMHACCIRCLCMRILCKLFHLSLSLSCSLAPKHQSMRLFLATPKIQYRSKVMTLLLISTQISSILMDDERWFR